MAREQTQHHSTPGRQSCARRGNTLILVTAILVLLVIIATAFISRAQSGRVIAAAQRKAIDRTDRSEVAVGVLVQEISGALFPKLANSNDPALSLNYTHTSSTPRLRVSQWTDTATGVVHKIERHGMDPQWFQSPELGYNHAPYIDRPWTNWPDAPPGWTPPAPTAPAGPGNPNGLLRDGYNLVIGDSDPLGNPGFADSRFLRSTEPIRSRDAAGRITGFSHWQHLSFPANAENGWRVCFDISNVAPFGPGSDPDDPTGDPNSGFTITYTAAEAFFANGAMDGGYYGITDPVALQSPYEQWLSSFAPSAINGGDFVGDFKNRRNQWFGSPATRTRAVNGYDAAFPNFFRFNDLGPKRDEFKNDTLRNIVSRTYADTDGDGFSDSFWFLLPGVSEDGVRQVAAVSIVDNASMVDVETATRFDRYGTTGETPADVALSSRLFLDQGGAGVVLDENDTWTGLFSDPQNIWPQKHWYPMGDGPASVSDPFFWGDNGDPGSPASEIVQTKYNPNTIGDDFSETVSWLRRVGVVRRQADSNDTVLSGVEAPFKTLLVSSRYGWNIDSAKLDRRRYFHSRQTGGKFFAIRRNEDGTWINNQPLASSSYMPRSFGNSDELELRLFNGANYAPIVSSLERTINRPWDIEHNLFRSTLTRSESVENWLEYTSPTTNSGWPPQQPIDPLHAEEYPPTGSLYPPGHQLTALQLLRDTRHRTTTYSATRNDIRPLWLRPTVLFHPQWDYMYGRAALSQLLDAAVPEDGNDGYPINYPLQNAEGKLHIDANRSGYQQSGRKIDLRGSLDGPLDEFESKLYAGDSTNNAYFPNPFNFWQEVPGPNATDQLRGKYLDPTSPQGQSLMLDRAYRFRTELQNTLDRQMGGVLHNGNEVYAQSYLGNSFANVVTNQNAYLKTLLLSASWAANIDTFRDSRSQGSLAWNLADTQGVPVATPVYIDQPIYPNFAPRVSTFTDSFLGGIDQDLVNLSFVGNEKQPFIMETFFALVYPKSKMSTQIVNQLENNELYTNENGDEPIEDPLVIPPGFYMQHVGFPWVDASSKPAIVFAIQVANPYEDPVSLTDMRLRIANSPRLLNFCRIPCPHPSALNDRVAPYFRPHELQLGPTLPDAPRTAIIYGIIPPNNDTGEVFEEAFHQPYEEFHQSWVDFLDLEPGNLFGYDAGLQMPALQTLVFDASPVTYHRQTPTGDSQPFTPATPSGLSSDPDVWFLAPEVSVELLRYVQNPRTFNPQSTIPNDGYMYVVDRLDNEVSGSMVDFKEHMSKLLDPRHKPDMGQGFQYTNDRKIWNGIVLKTVRDDPMDFFVSWVRAGRPWGWDRNRNGFYDMNEVSPRYVFSELPPDDLVPSYNFPGEKDAPTIGGAPGGGGGIGDGGGGGGGGGGQYTIPKNGWFYKLDSDPDGDPTANDEEERSPWLPRSYLLPLATRPTGGSGTGYAYEFSAARGKPVHFSTASALLPGSSDLIRKIDFDAGFPTFADGTVRMTADTSGWPGKPAANYAWALMDKGQERRDTIPANRSGTPIGQDTNGNGVDDGLEMYDRIWLEKDQWAYPLQMLQKNGDFDQIGEVNNVFMWGHAIRHRPGFTTPDSLNGIPVLPTVATLGEIMNGTKVDDLFPIVSADIGDIGVPNPGRIHTNRYHADPGNLTAQPGAAVEPFRPYTQVLDLKQWSGTGYEQPWIPMLPAGTGIFDSLVCDGPGANHSFMPAMGVQDPVALHMSYMDDSFDNAGGFSGRPVRGMINLNTASPEVLRTLPHMSRLIYNDSRAWHNADPSWGVWYGYKAATPVAGDVWADDQGGHTPRGGEDDINPDNKITRNHLWVRVPEMIDRYRRGEGMLTRAEPHEFMPYSGNVGMPAYLDRGTIDINLLSPMVTLNGQYPALEGELGLFPGMRRDQGIASVGELLLLERPGWDTSNSPQTWPHNSVSIRNAGLDPYHYQFLYGYGNTIGASTSPEVAGSYPYARLLGLGWRHPFLNNGFYAEELAVNPPLQADARLSTDVQHTSFRKWAGNANSPGETWVEIPDNVAMDAEEANLLFSGISNLVGTRSDTFTVYMKIRSFKQDSVTGLWNAMDPEFVVDDSRYVFVVDRSRCDSPNDEPEIRLLSKVPN